MVAALAFLATAVATVFAQATLARYTARHKPYELAWTVSLAMFALGAAAFATGSATGWDLGTFRVFFLFGAVLNVPWLALGTVYLLVGPAAGRRAQRGLVLFSGFAAGVVLAAPAHGTIHPGTLPQGSHVFATLPRALAGIGSGVGAAVVFAGAAWSAVRLARTPHVPGSARLAAGNALIATGTLVLSAGGLLQGTLGHDTAFAATLAIGITVIYAGFVVASTAEVRPRGAALAARAHDRAGGSARVVELAPDDLPRGVAG